MSTELKIINVGEINGRSVDFAIKVLVVRLTEKLGFGFDDGKPTFELIVADEMGDKIIINIRNSFKRSFEAVLKQWDHFLISFPTVVDSPAQFRSKHLQHEYKLQFTKKTKVDKIPSAEWNGSNGFSFIPFSSLITPQIAVGVSADVIGRVTTVSPVGSFGDSSELQAKYLNLELSDLDGLKVSVTLWGQFYLDFENHIKAVGSEATVILLMQFGVTKKNSGQLSVSTDWKHTKVWIDSDIPAIVEFLKSCTEIHATQETSSSLAPALSTLPLRDPQTWFDDAAYVGLDQLKLATVGTYIVKGTIITILPDDSWYYIACKKCSRRAKTVLPNSDLTIDVDALLSLDRKCFGCNETPEAVVRFKVPIRVENESGTSSFTLFEGVIKKYVTKSAYELLKELSEADDYPDELDVLLRKSLIFKIQIKSFNKERDVYNYTVKDATDDPVFFEIYEKFKVERLAEFVELDVEGSSSKPNSSVYSASNSSFPTADLSLDSILTPPPLKKIKQEALSTPVSVKSSSTKNPKVFTRGRKQ